jgi:hypothetical protein
MWPGEATFGATPIRCGEFPSPTPSAGDHAGRAVRKADRPWRHRDTRIARITLAYRHLTVGDHDGMRDVAAAIAYLGILSSEHTPWNPSVVAIRRS